MRAWRPAKWKLFSQPNMVFGCVLLFGWDRATNGDPAKNFLFPTQRRRPVTSVRDECDERNSFEKSDLCTTLQVPAPVWMFEPLGGKSSAQTRKSEEKNILRSLRSNKLFLQSKSPRVGWVG